MSDWKEYKLGELATFYNGRAYKNGEFKTSGTPIVRIQNLTGEGKTVYSDLQLDENKYIENGDLIYAWSATFGPYIWRGEKSIYHYHIWKIVCNEKIIDKFYFYYKLKLISDSLKDNGNGSIFVHITKSFMENFKIKIPSLEKQKYISNILSNLDKKIRFNTQINQTLEQIAQALFKSWFVDFDPVRAKVQALSDGLSLEQAELAAMQAISGKTPEELTALSQAQPDRYAELAETAKAFPCEMVEVDGVEVPKGWEQTILSEICEMQNGYAFKSSEWTDTGIPVIKIGSIQSKILTVEGNGFVSEDNLSLRSNFVLNGGDIVIGLTGAYVGKVGRMPANKKAMLNQRVAKFLAKQINESETFYSFIYMNMIQEDFKNFVDFTAQGSAQPNISTRDILKYPLLLANTEVHLAFEKLLKKTLDKSIFNSYQNEILSNSRDLLLPRLLGGENYEQ